MSLISFVSSLICLGIIASAFRRHADILSPARVFAFVWSFAIGLSELKLSRLQHDWGLETWIVLLTGPAAFLCGTYAVYVLNLDSRLLSPAEIRGSWRGRRIDHRKLYAGVVILLFLFLAAYATLVLSGREIPLFSQRPEQARRMFHMFGVGLLTNNVVMIVFLTILYCVSKAGDGRRKSVLVALSFISFLMYFITLQRLSLLTTMILGCVLVYYTTRKIRLSTLPVVLVPFLAAFTISSIRSGGLVYNALLFISSQMRIHPSWGMITEPYMYTVMSLEMFARSIERLDQFTYGYYTFDFVTALTGIKHWMQEYFNLIETPYLHSGYNTYTAFWAYYRDFGLLGAFSIGFVGGAWLSAIYYSFRKEPSYLSLTAYCIAVYLMLLSLVNSQISFLWIVYEITILLLVVLLSTWHNKRLLLR